MANLHSDVLEICTKDGYEIRSKCGTNGDSAHLYIEYLMFEAFEIRSFVPRLLSSCWILFEKTLRYLFLEEN